MADYTKIISFIKTAEGGYVNNPLDKGGETNKGITYTSWKSFFGDTHDRFMAMSDADWSTIYKKGYWDAVCGDQINNQFIAEELADWAWGSGRYYPAKTLQIILQQLGYALTVDGAIGPNTINDINAANPKVLYKALVIARIKFLVHIVITTPTQAVFIDGWINRMMNLIFSEVTI